MTFQPIALHAANPGPMTGAGNQTFMIVEGDEAILVDAGVGHARHLQAIDETLALSGAVLRSVIATHGHMDHISGAAALVAAHAGLACLKYPWPVQDARVDVTWAPLSDEQTIPIGDTALRVVHTPGHSPDHCVLWHQESATVFTGDLVMLGSSVIIPVNRGGDLKQYLQSLERVLALDARVLLPAHGPVITDPRSALESAIVHRLEREAQVVAALGAGRSQVSAIAESIYHGLRAALMPAAQENVRAHLEKLRQEQRAEEFNGEWQLSSSPRLVRSDSA